jgi:hypothetical protein
VKNYLFNLLIALDQGVNTLLAGYPDETISLRAARERDINNKKWACVLCKVLDLFQEDHCTKTVVSKRLSILYRRLG